MRTSIVLGMMWLVSVSCLAATCEEIATPGASWPSHQRNRSIGRGVDFGVFFRAYDLESDTWLPEPKQALIP